MPIAITASDNILFAEIRNALSLGPDAPLPYRSDDPPSAFELFRITKHPEDYRDFEGSLVSVLSNEIVSTGEYYSSATFLDSIEANVKYYYTFRSVDVHNNYSNPTAVYEVQLAEDHGASYLLVKTVEFKKRSKTMLSKQMKKLINIVPRITQTIATVSDLDNFVTAEGLTPTLGVEEDSLMGKRFKIRVISKETGKKIDLNVRFKMRQV